MAIKKAAKFALWMQADGSSTEFEVLMAASPFFFVPVDAGDVVQATFNLAALIPSDVVDVSSSTGTVSDASITTFGTKLKVEFSTTPSAGSLIIFGRFIF